MRLHPPSAVSQASAADGTLLYQVDLSPQALPPVHARDLQSAWEAARALSRRSSGVVRRRCFRFPLPDGGTPGDASAGSAGEAAPSVELLLTDPDACCWANGAEQVSALDTSYGVSLCLRLLALVELLARAPWARPLLRGGRGTAEPHPALLRAAAAVALTAEARLDEDQLRMRLGRLATLPDPAAAV